MHKTGYLTPQGILLECESYEHLEKAKEAVEGITNTSWIKSGLEAENYLLDLGYIVVRARDAYANLGYGHSKDPDKFLHLTAEQKKWLENNYEDFNLDLREAVDKLIDFYDKE